MHDSTTNSKIKIINLNDNNIYNLKRPWNCLIKSHKDSNTTSQKFVLYYLICWVFVINLTTKLRPDFTKLRPDLFMMNLKFGTSFFTLTSSLLTFFIFDIVMSLTHDNNLQTNYIQILQNNKIINLYSRITCCGRCILVFIKIFFNDT